MAKLVDITYSQAIFEYALESNRLEQFQKEFDFFAQALIDYPDYFEIIKTPTINFEEKKTIITEAFKDSISEEMLNFLKIVLDKKRGSELLNIKRDFDRRVDEHNNILKASVESVIPLTDEQLGALSQNLEKMTGKNIVLVSSINPALVGGLVVKMGDQIIDGSVKFKLESMLEGLTQIII
ncbi:MAG: ATP synthase F1 subunit delta [Clostridia bacterium]|nr:ATP synthase F1 subunit delta [Clostridia bacterium]